MTRTEVDLLGCKVPDLGASPCPQTQPNLKRRTRTSQSRGFRVPIMRAAHPAPADQPAAATAPIGATFCAVAAVRAAVAAFSASVPTQGLRVPIT